MGQIEQSDVRVLWARGRASSGPCGKNRSSRTKPRRFDFSNRARSRNCFLKSRIQYFQMPIRVVDNILQNTPDVVSVRPKQLWTRLVASRHARQTATLYGSEIALIVLTFGTG